MEYRPPPPSPQKASGVTRGPRLFLAFPSHCRATTCCACRQGLRPPGIDRIISNAFTLIFSVWPPRSHTILIIVSVTPPPAPPHTHTRRDAAKLACVCKAAAEAIREVRRRRAVRVEPSGAVLEPASGAFDVTVPPGVNVQAAVNGCPRGGCVLLLPGIHEGPLELAADKEVHVFGRGRATLRTTPGDVISSAAATATIDGLIVRREADDIYVGTHSSVSISGGRLRLQACSIIVAANAARSGISIEGGADPLITSCVCGV